MQAKGKNKKASFIFFRTKGIEAFEVKNDLHAFSYLEKAYNLLEGDDFVLESYLLQSAYKGIWSSYSRKQFELMEYLASIVIQLACKQKDLIKQAKAYNARALAFYGLGKPSIEYNKKASLIFEELIRSSSAKYKSSEIKSLVKSKIKNDFGIVIYFARKDDFFSASKIVDATTQLSKEYKLYIEEGLSYKIKGNLLFCFGRYKLSFDCLFKAKSIFSCHKTKSSQKQLVQLYLLICENCFKLKRYIEGKKYLDYVLLEYNGSNTYELPYIFYALLGEYYSSYKKDTKNATKNYLKSVEVLNSSKWAIITESNISSFLKYKDKESIYIKAIEGLIKEDRALDALVLLEQFRAKIFLEGTLEELGDSSTVIPKALRQERKEIVKSLAFYKKDLSNTSISNNYIKIQELKNKLYDCDEKISSLEKGKHSLSTLFQKEDIKKIISFLPKRTLTIIYFYSDTYCHIFLVGKEIFKVVSSTFNSSIEENIRQYLAIMNTNKSSYSAIEEDYYKGQIFEILIDPIKSYLNKIDEIIIIPFKVLHSFPLHYLFLEAKDYLLISYLPSFQSISALNKTSFNALSPILLIGDPRDNLDGARKEAESISKLFNQKELLLGSKANKKKVLSSFEEYSIIHYSGHIRFNNRCPLYSFLEFGEEDEVEDSTLSFDAFEGTSLSLLSLKEIYKLKLNNIKFLSLSGCSSGLGKYYLGEEIVGLLRGFFYAGVRSILSTFWDIEDKSSKEFLELFFEQTLKNNGNKKLGFLKSYKIMQERYKYPFFYGGFGLYEGL